MNAKGIKLGKENVCANSKTQAAKQLRIALLRPMARLFKELTAIKVSMVCERQNFFDDVDSVGFSEMSYLEHNLESIVRLSQADAFKISFANLADHAVHGVKKKNAIQVFMALVSVRNRVRFAALQEIRVHVLRRDLSTVSERLAQISREHLRKIIIQKMRNDELLQMACLNFWRQQVINEQVMHYAINKISNSMKSANKRTFGQIMVRISQSYAAKKIVHIVKTNLIVQFRALFVNIKAIAIYKSIQKLINNNRNMCLSLSFEKLRTNTINEKLFTVLQTIMQGNKLQILQMIRLFALRKKRQLNSYTVAVEALNSTMKSVQLKYALKKLRVGKKTYNSLKVKILVLVLQNLKNKSLRTCFQEL